MKATKYLSKLTEKRTRNVLAIIAMFACTSICFGDPPTITIDSDRRGVRVAANSHSDDGTGPFSLDPNNCTLIIKERAIVGQASGAYVSENSNFRSATGNKIIVHGGNFKDQDINGACSAVSTRDVNVNDNIVEINAGGNIRSVFGGYTRTGTVFGNKVFINNKVTIGGGVFGGRVNGNGNTNNNEVTITDVTVRGGVFGGNVYSGNVHGGYVRNNGNANNNEVTITGVTVNGDVLGGCVDGDGNAKNNKVIINGGKIKGSVFGGFVDGFGNGNATRNTITIIKTPEFRNNTILCGGFCAKDRFDKFTGNTLIIKETKGIKVKGISNFENYEFYLSEDIKSQEPVLTTSDGGCSWEKRIGGHNDYSRSRPVKLSNTNITVYSEGVMDKGKYILIRSLQGFEGVYNKFTPSPANKGPVVYKWDLEIVNRKDPPKAKDLIATLVQKSITPSAAALCKGHGTAILLVNDGLDCILKTMEESEGLPDKRKNHIEAFAGTSLCSLNYNTDKTNPQETKTNSVVAGAKVTLELGGKDLTTAIFGEYGTGTSKIECYKDSSNAKSSCMGGGLFAKYDLYKDESVGQKIYGELALTAGQTRNDFNGTINNAEVKYKDSKNIYEGFELGIGHKHKINKDIKLEENLRYMFTHGNKKDQELIKQRTIEFDSVMSNRIKIGAKGTYTGMVLKPYLGLWYEQELGGKVKAAIQDGLDKLSGVSSTTSKGLTVIAELGASVKVWKLDLDLSGQGCIGKRNGFAGTLRIKYTFLRKKQIYLEEAKEKFKEAKCLYDNKEYLRATDVLSCIALLYPKYEPSKHFYKEIAKMMSKTANNCDEVDFGKITYARAYVAYYNADYKKALSEWEKYINFTGGTEEVNEYRKKTVMTLKFEGLEKKEAELNTQSEKMLKTGIQKYNSGQWMECVKIMEKLKQFTIKNNSSKTLEYYGKAKEYISKSVAELSKAMSKNKVTEQGKAEYDGQEKVEYDEIAADKKYTDGLVLYTQGKYYEAERSWEFALRLNPNHKKAKVALKKLKENMSN